MGESLAFQAFVIGIICACSLPLGAVTSLLWRPSDRAMAFLMAFGGGALLAALTIDLVASALERGHFHPLSLGCVIGGLLFVGLNEIVNDYGGFLRKASTTIYHLRRQDHIRYRRLMSQLKGVDFLAGLDDDSFRDLSRSFYRMELDEGRWIFGKGDPSDALYCVEAGAVDLLDPAAVKRVQRHARPGDAFGRLPFLLGSPQTRNAVTAERTTLIVLPRRALLAKLEESSTLRQLLHRALRHPDVGKHLARFHGFTPERIEAWEQAAAHAIFERGEVPVAVDVERHEDDFMAMDGQVARVPVFSDLPPTELASVASKLMYKCYPRGTEFFHDGDVADRMFIIHTGDVSLFDPRGRLRRARHLDEGDAFGVLSFFSGGKHTASAVATEDTCVWELTRTDLEELLHEAVSLRGAVAEFLQEERLKDYLTERQRLDQDLVSRWTGGALSALATGKLNMILSVQRKGVELQHGAALAIWLGILLDGVPESFVIGASMTHSTVSLSLIAGLFLSNYPEALSSSVGMRQQGFSVLRILTMWTSLMIITGLGAAVGQAVLEGAPLTTLALVEGIAAGAMLTMIAQTMLPEAYLRGGSIVGFATLLGFLAAIFCKTLE